jgi:BASS family bile acid:Na+ symporter
LALPLPGLLLAALLFNAGLAVPPGRLWAVARRPGLLTAGLLANLLLPLVYVAVAAVGLRVWHDPYEAGCLVAGLAMVAAMPVAGSATAWAQRADGDMGVSLGLVLGSTLLSPLTTPVSLATAHTVVGGPTENALAAAAGQQAGGFLAGYVVLPTVAGVLVRAAIGAGWPDRNRAALKGWGTAAVLVLCYANAAAALPQVTVDPDWDFLVLVAGVAVGLCVASFAAGWVVARWFGAGRAEAAALMFGLGMSNNGTGLVVATAIEAPTEVLLPLLVYNLAQHVVAGAACRLGRTAETPAALGRDAPCRA